MNSVFDLSLERLEKLRMMALLVACVLLALGVAFDIDWLDWPRGLAWITAGAISYLEGRAIKRDGGDPDAHYIRGAVLAVIGVIAIL